MILINILNYLKFDEIKILHYKYANIYELIYEDRFDEDTKMYYILEEKCGSPPFNVYYNKNKSNQR